VLQETAAVRYLFGPCLLDTQCAELYWEHARVPLRSTALETLAYLVTHHDRIVSRDELLAHVWPDKAIAPTVLDSCIMAIRRAIGDSGQGQRMLRTLRGYGYRFVAPVAVLHPLLPAPEHCSSRSHVPVTPPSHTLSHSVVHERALTILQALWRHVAQGRGQVVGVTGSPGSGTSQLMLALSHRLPLRPGAYVHGHCRLAGHDTPYGLIATLLRYTCGITAADHPDVVTTKVHRRLHEVGLTPTQEVPHLVRLLCLPGTVSYPVDNPQAFKAGVFATLLRLYQRSSQQHPLVLVVEDLQWIDALSAEWLTLLVQQLATLPLLLLVTYCPGYPLPWIDRSYAHQIALSALYPPPSQDRRHTSKLCLHCESPAV
jgi:DNA-binding winged helix-turn-helix (wHTH) protein